MRATMRCASALLLLAVALAAGPAAAGKRELIRFRGPDGTPGLVDDAEKLPPGALVLERSPLPAVTSEDPPADEDAERVPEPAAEEAPARLDESAHAERCLQYDLSRGCSDGQLAEAAGWCQRARDVHGARAEAEQALERAEEAYEECRTAGGTVPFCSRRRLDAAEHAVEDAEQGLEQLEQECRSAECLPGWIREDCEG